MQVGLRNHVQRVALGLCPADEVPVVLRPAGGRVVLAEAVGVGPFLVTIARRVTSRAARPGEQMRGAPSGSQTAPRVQGRCRLSTGEGRSPAAPAMPW